MNGSSRSLRDLPPVGTRVILVGLKNPNLNEQIGYIENYSRDYERVIVALEEGGPQSIVKVKPKQIEIIDEGSYNNGRSSSNGRGNGGGGGRPGLNRGQSTRSRMMNGSSRSMNNRSNGSGMRRTASVNSFQTNGTDPQEELMETLRSADAMFDLADTSGDGLLSREEFMYYMQSHTDHTKATIRDAFYMIDVDGNGDITRDEVRNAFLKKRRDLKGETLSESKRTMEDEMLAVSKDADALFDKADVDRNGALTKNEFELFMKRHTNHSDAAIHELFDSMDADHDGYITRQEVRNAYMAKKKGDLRGGSMTLKDILGLEDDDMEEIEDDVYSMFFLSDVCSQAFWFAILVFFLKLGLIIIIAIDLYTEGFFPASDTVPALVKTTQFLLLPVNVSVQEELITTFFIYANLKWSREILELSPGASKAKFHAANFMRFIDGLAFLFINTTLLLQASQVLSAFLNFAALQFLSSIDNVALHLARDGYLTESLETVAGDVLLMKLPKNHNEKMQVMDSLLLATTYILTLVAWIMFTFFINM